MNLSTVECKLSEIYFPLTANPAGYNHLLLAENVLWQFPETQLLVFLLSNGRHPDPFKTIQIADAYLRYEILRSAISDWSNPEKSLPARYADESGISLKLGRKNCAISRYELSLSRPLRLADHVQYFSIGEKISLVVGADLIQRMLNPRIFTDNDLAQIERNCLMIAAPRDDIDLNQTLELIKQKRGVELNVNQINQNVLPKKIQKFNQISSTHIRKAALAEHSLETFLPANAALYISQNPFFNIPKQKTDSNYSYLNEHQHSCFELREKLESAAIKLQIHLAKRAKKGLPHRFSILETSTGGQITQTFTSLKGASENFLDGRVIYDREAQKQFLDIKEFEDTSVSQTRALNLASAIQRQSGADWALAETGMAGPPSKDRNSSKNGQCYLGLVISTEVRYKFLEFNPFLTRKEHQLMFAIEALVWAENELRKNADLNK